MDIFIPLYNWFKNNLRLISPETKFLQFKKSLIKDDFLSSEINYKLQELDTGISHLDLIETNLSPLSLIFNEIKNLNEIINDNYFIYFTDSKSNRYIIYKKSNDLKIKKLVSYHLTKYESEIELALESPGTLRIIDLLPIFIHLQNPDSPILYVLDELDRSLHSLLTRKMLNWFLSTRTEHSSSQLIFTTHDFF